MITRIEAYRALKQAGATFALTPDGKVDVMLIEGTTLPADLDAALVVHQQVIGAIAIATDRKEGRHWHRLVALAETRIVLNRIGARLGELPEPLRARQSQWVRVESQGWGRAGLHLLERELVTDASAARTTSLFDLEPSPGPKGGKNSARSPLVWLGRTG